MSPGRRLGRTVVMRMVRGTQWDVSNMTWMTNLVFGAVVEVADCGGLDFAGMQCG